MWWKYVIGILFFAVVTSILYIWGLKKAGSQQKDLLMMLYVNGSRKVLKNMKKQTYMTRKEIQELVSGITASEFYSKNKAVVTDQKEFAKNLVEYMTQRNMICEVTYEGRKVYSLVKK